MNILHHWSQKAMCGTTHLRTPLDDWLSIFAAVRPGSLASNHQLVATSSNVLCKGQVTMPHDSVIMVLIFLGAITDWHRPLRYDASYALWASLTWPTSCYWRAPFPNYGHAGMFKLLLANSCSTVDAILSAILFTDRFCWHLACHWWVCTWVFRIPCLHSRLEGSQAFMPTVGSLFF